MKAIFIPGNGGGNPRTDHWFPFLNRALTAAGITVVAEPFPDNVIARQSIWLPHIESLGADAQTVLIGHSSGAIAAMRYAERHRILGSVLVSGYHTDLKHPMEVASGYFTAPWDWDAIRTNQTFIIQFNSSDDGFIPVEEARVVHDMLQSDYTEFTDRGHFFQSVFPEITEKLLAHMPTAPDALRADILRA